MGREASGRLPEDVLVAYEVLALLELRRPIRRGEVREARGARGPEHVARLTDVAPFERRAE